MILSSHSEQQASESKAQSVLYWWYIDNLDQEKLSGAGDMQLQPVTVCNVHNMCSQPEPEAGAQWGKRMNVDQILD